MRYDLFPVFLFLLKKKKTKISTHSTQRRPENSDSVLVVISYEVLIVDT